MARCCFPLAAAAPFGAVRDSMACGMQPRCAIGFHVVRELVLSMLKASAYR